jgi:glycosyltransferase involved in cell wall biosynthesis
MRLRNKIIRLLDLIKNFFDFKKNKIFYIVEPADWSIKWDGINIVNFLKKDLGVNCSLSTVPFFLKNKIVHFGSIGTFLEFELSDDFYNKNKIVVTWFHITNEQLLNKKIVEKLNSKVDIVHTSCEITKEKLIEIGVKKEKLVVIPLGVDLKIFKNFKKNKEIFKKKLNIPRDKFLIGSFQKDGEGWEEGNKPKMIKGPDVFCEVVKKISSKKNIHILLTGPARGYVVDFLEKNKISYTHNFLGDYLEIPKYYAILDLYLITSRAEGGPKAIIESMASGVPIVSTKVGMAPDYMVDIENGMLCDIEDVDNLVDKSIMVIENIILRKKLIKNGLKTAKDLDMKKIADRYYNEIYKKLEK